MKNITIVAQDKEHLKDLILNHIIKYGNNCDLNHIDISQVTEMKNLFLKTNFNGNISKWDTSNVTDMSYMFIQSQFFTQDLSNWRPYNAKINGMFHNIADSYNKPYWSLYEDVKERKMAIDSYVEKKALKKNLEKDLYNNTSKKTPIKI